MGSRKPSIPNQKLSAETEATFLSAYEDYADAVFRHVMLRVRDREVAKDVVQETFSRTWLYLSRHKEVGHMRAFLYKVANNLIVDTMRRKRNVSLDAMMEDHGFEPADPNVEEPKDVLATQEAMRLLASLDEIYRTAITMRYIDELSPREIAHALGVSENVVSVRIHRGIERLSKLVRRDPPKTQ